MKVSELIERLEELQEDHGDLEVVVAHQPNYPLAARLANATVCRSSKGDRRLRGGLALFLACSESDEYAPGAAWNEEPSIDDDDDGEEDE